jgi:hypothetical protein
MFGLEYNKPDHIKGLKEVGFLTSDTILHIDELPESIGIIRGMLPRNTDIFFFRWDQM